MLCTVSKGHGRRRWERDEIDALQQAFKNHAQPPTFGDIQALQATGTKLRLRTKAQIKSRAWVLIQARNKVAAEN
jgi:hypothetical protein